MFKKIFIVLSILLVIAFAGASYYVSTIDWNKYKTNIASQIENITGKKVVINGKVNLTFFPTPHLKANDIKIYGTNQNANSEPLAQIKEMVTDLRLFPLLHRQFVVDNMNLLDSQILIKFLNNGKTNWYSDVGDDEDFNLSDVDIEFNSVTLQNATVRIINEALGLDTSFDKLNADISAQSLNGPFRIDGNFIKDNTPAGFALNLGTLSESFSTSLNLVLTHPNSESYARFDGAILSNNSEIQGNFTVESQKPSTFVNTIASKVWLPEKYNYPLAASIELIINPEQVDLSSFVVKYGDNLAGAGKVLIPLKAAADERKKVRISFEMTDLDLMPFRAVLEEYLKDFDGNKKPYTPSFDYDVVADISSTRAYLNNQTIRNFKISADMINNVLSIKTLSGLLPGDTDVSLTGDVFENEKTLSYDFKVQAMSQDFLKFLEWINIKPTVQAQSTYRNASAVFGFAGTLNEIKLVPFEFSMDKIETTGAIGIKRDRRNAFFVSLQSENINFDNYLPNLTDEERKQPFVDRIKTLLNKLKFLNDVDVHALLTLGLGIYDKIPFEDVELDFDVTDGKVDIKNLDIKQIASSSLNFKGGISNLGVNPSFENFKYSFDTSDFTAFQNKLKLDLPDWPLFNKAKKVQSKGIASGTLDNSNAKVAMKIEKTALNYTGRIFRQENDTYLRGNLEIKAPDFVEFVKDLGYEYNPKEIVANIFTLNSDIEGTLNDWQAKEINAFIGSNNFKGTLSYILQKDKPFIKADIWANIFEFDRFVFAPAKKIGVVTKKTKDTFWSRPRFDDTELDYHYFQNFDLDGQFKIKNLSYLNDDIENVSTFLNVKDGIITVKDFKAEKNAAEIKANFAIDINKTPKIKGDYTIQNYEIENFGGSVYAFTKGNLKLKAEYDAPATSESDFIKGLNGKLSFDISKPVLKGFDIEAIESDLEKRTHSDYLEDVIEKYLKQGESKFDFMNAEIEFSQGDYIIKNAGFTSSLANLDLKGSGSIIDWTTDATFNLTLQRIKDNVLPISFYFKESISNPKLSIDTTDLKNKYDSYWAKIEEEKRAKEEARIKKLKDDMSLAQGKVDKVTNLINVEILPRLKRYKPFGEKTGVNNVYESVEIQVTDILNALKDMKESENYDYNTEEIEKINIQTDIYEQTVIDLIKQLDDNYLFDLKLHAANDYQKVVGIYQNTQEKSQNYQNTLNSYALRLMQMGSLVVLDQEDVVRQNKNIIISSINKISDLYDEAGKLKEQIENNEKIALLDKQYQNMANVTNQAEKELEILNTSLEELFEYVQDLVYFEQTGEHKIKENSQEKELQENEEITDESEKTDNKTVNAVPQKEQIKEEPKAKEVIQPTKFTKKDKEVEEKPKEETKEELKNQEVSKKKEVEAVNANISQKEEPVVEQKPVVPLLVQKDSEYAAKAMIGGTVLRKGSQPPQNEVVQQTEKKLLRPVQGDVFVEGTVKRK